MQTPLFVAASDTAHPTLATEGSRYNVDDAGAHVSLHTFVFVGLPASAFVCFLFSSEGEKGRDGPGTI